MCDKETILGKMKEEKDRSKLKVCIREGKIVNDRKEWPQHHMER
jgi:hypothetical protein